MNPFTEFWQAITAKYPFPPYNEDWQTENEWYSTTFWPQENVDYNALLEYSRLRSENLDKAISSINQKAEWMFGLTTAAVGFMTTRVTGTAWIDSTLLLALIAALVTLWLSLRSRLPETRPLPMPVRSILELAHKGELPSAWLTASMHLVNEGLVVVDTWKGRQLKAASRSLIVMCACFAIHGLLSGLHHPGHSQPSESGPAVQNPTDAGSVVEQAKQK